ncbi:MAG: hypothetical protein C6Y22_29625, partial [Hapalosiphonaceae cyanobacterium JJU2]
RAEGNSGGIQISSKDISLTDGAVIGASTSGKGNAGSIIITATGNIFVSGENNNGLVSAISSEVYSTADGNSGGIQISSKDISLTDGAKISATTFGNGNAGSVNINATGNISASGESNKGLLSEISSEVYSRAEVNSGGIQIITKDLYLTDGGIINASTFGNGNAGSVNINATGNISASGESKNGSNSGIFSQVNENAQGDAGGIQIITKDLYLTDGGRISASTLGTGNAGSVNINATGNISASGESKTGFFSGILSVVNPSGFGNAGGIEIKTNNLSLTDGGIINASTYGKGNSGGIEIKTNNLSLKDGGTISATTFGKGNAGAIIINATGNISAQGEGNNENESGIYSQVTSNAEGNSDGIQINTNNLSLTDGGLINANTYGKGNAGSIIINATGNISVSGNNKNGFG